MQLYHFQRRIIITVLLALLCAPLAAQDIDQLSRTETKDKWGQVMFCQRIYKMPEVQSRLYDFDVEHCDRAAQLMADVVTRYSSQEQVQLKYQAEQHAVRLTRNTREPYHAVAACREYCKTLTGILDKRND